MAKRKRTKGQTMIAQHTYKTKDRVTRTPLKSGGERRCSGRVSSSCSTSIIKNNNKYIQVIFLLKQKPVKQLL